MCNKNAYRLNLFQLSKEELGIRVHSLLTRNDTPVQIIEHVPGYCQVCGEELGHLPGLLAERRQVVDIPPIAPFS